MLCGQDGCTAAAIVKAWWPGSDPVALCHPHALKAKAVAEAMGFSLPMKSIITGQEVGGPDRFELLETD